jgi:sarcosine oxidase
VDATRRDWDAIVVGLGAIGSAAAYWLSRSLGDRVLGLERFGLDHPNGASADHSRIIRLSYHRPDYVRLAKRAYTSWAEVEAESGERIVTTTGGLDLWPTGSAIPESDYSESLAAEDVSFDSLDGAEIRRRWPQWNVADDVRGIWQAAGGLADPYRGNAAHRRLATTNGATLRHHAPVTAIRDAGGGDLEVVTTDATYRTSRVVLATDAWTNQLLAGFDRRLPLTITKEQVTYFACPDPGQFAPDRFPVWIWMDDPCFYGFPIFGEPGTKAGQDAGGQEVSAETRTFEPDQAALRRTMEFLERYIPRSLGPIIYTKTCLYTLTPDRDFVIDRLPDHPNVVIGIGGGHGYKFASLIGRILSELAIDGRTERNIEPFRIERAILQLLNPPVNYMV